MCTVISVRSLERIIEESITNKIIEEENKIKNSPKGGKKGKEKEHRIRWTNRKQIVGW